MVQGLVSSSSSTTSLIPLWCNRLKSLFNEMSICALLVPKYFSSKEAEEQEKEPSLGPWHFLVKWTDNIIWIACAWGILIVIIIAQFIHITSSPESCLCLSFSSSLLVRLSFLAAVARDWWTEGIKQKKIFDLIDKRMINPRFRTRDVILIHSYPGTGAFYDISFRIEHGKRIEPLWQQFPGLIGTGDIWI